MSQDLNHFSFRILPSAAIGSQLHHHFMARNGSHVHSFRNKDIHRNSWIIRDHKAEMFTLFKHTDHSLVGTFQYFNNDSLSFPVLCFLFHNDLDRISVHSILCVIRCNEHISFAAFNGHKAKSSRMGGENAGLCKAFCLCVFSFF